MSPVLVNRVRFVMYKHILLPTDGSRLAAKGVKAGVKLAKALGAKVTGVYVIPRYMPPVYGDAVAFIPEMTPERFNQAMKKEAAKALSVVEAEARAAGVRCAIESPTDNQPWQGILRVARSKKCDAIAMASHGRGGLSGLILGSETARVLAHSKIPVMVLR
jgi:nucleotide-binding universal stress UspA family protein